MKSALGPLALAFLVAAGALSPLASAHAAPDPLGNAVHLLADEGEDAFYWYDGYDLYNLFAREAYVPTLDETGIVFRFTLYGGYAPAGTSGELAIDVEAVGPEGERSLAIATSDDHEWEGDMHVLVANVTEDAPPWTGVTARMQTFASYEDLGVAPGASLEEVAMVSRADDDVRDVAPGGVFLPHSQGQGEVPVGESQRLVDALELQGPHGYVDVEPVATDEGVELRVENTLENGQHVQVALEAPEGWNATVNGSAQASLPGGETTTFAIEAEAGPEASQPLAVDVVTDLGGLQSIVVGVNGTALQPALEAQSVDVDPAEPETDETPGAGALAVLAALAGVAAIARRSRN